jgi:hypothetical protein
MRYSHTQTSYGPWLIAVAGIVVLGVLFASTGTMSGSNLAIILVLLLIAVIGVVFARLTVTVDPVSVVAAFGVGWPRRQTAVGEIVAARQVRNKWWYGWGIRKIPDGWMYNVWGLDAIELELRSGKILRIGTDEPGALLAALPATSAG